MFVSIYGMSMWYGTRGLCLRDNINRDRWACITANDVHFKFKMDFHDVANSEVVVPPRTYLRSVFLNLNTMNDVVMDLAILTASWVSKPDGSSSLPLISSGVLSDDVNPTGGQMGM